MSTDDANVKPVLPEIGEAERAAQHFNALRCRIAAGEDVTEDELREAFVDLAEAPCESNRDALSLLAYARFSHQTAVSVLDAGDLASAMTILDDGQVFVSRALEYLERDTGVSAWDFLEPEQRAKIQ